MYRSILNSPRNKAGVSELHNIERDIQWNRRYFCDIDITGPIGQVKKLSWPKVNWLDHWHLSQEVGIVKSVKTQTHPFWLHAKWLFETMQSHGRSLKLRHNPYLDSVGAGGDLARATTREGEQFPRNTMWSQ